MKYYEIITIGKREIMEVMDDDFNVIERYDVKRQGRQWVLKNTELPATDDSMIEVIKRGSALSAFMTTEPVEGSTDYLKVTGYMDFTSDQLEKYANNATRK